MSQVSKRSVAKDIERRMQEILWDSFASLRRSKDAELFLSDLLTPTEKIVLAKRLAIAVLLSRGYDNEAIMGILLEGIFGRNRQGLVQDVPLRQTPQRVPSQESSLNLSFDYLNKNLLATLAEPCI